MTKFSLYLDSHIYKTIMHFEQKLGQGNQVKAFIATPKEFRENPKTKCNTISRKIWYCDKEYA